MNNSLLESVRRPEVYTQYTQKALKRARNPSHQTQNPQTFKPEAHKTELKKKIPKTLKSLKSLNTRQHAPFPRLEDAPFASAWLVFGALAQSGSD
jgi:hypothetical protein